MRARCSLDTDPWWARASSGSAPADAPAWPIAWAGGRRSGGGPVAHGSSSPAGGPAPSASSVAAACASRRSCQVSLSWAVNRSARRRELVNTSVEVWDATRSTTRSLTCGQIERRCSSPAALPTTSPVGVPRSDRSGTGTTTETSKRLSDGGCTTRTGRPPDRNRATSWTGRTVADSPTRCAGRSSSASSRSRVTARWAPRLVPATAWISSRMIVSTPSSDSRAREVRTRNSDSGVVMSTSGGRRARVRRSCELVSPERTPTVVVGSGRPSRWALARMPVSGERRLRSTSTASALRGDT